MLNLNSFWTALDKIKMQKKHPTTPTYNTAQFTQYFEKNYIPTEVRIKNIQTRSNQHPNTPATDLYCLALCKVVNTLSFAETAEGEMADHLLKLSKDAVDRHNLKRYAQEEIQHGELFNWMLNKLDLVPASNLGLDTEQPAKLENRAQAVMAVVVKLLNLGRLVDIANLLLAGEVISITYYRLIAKASPAPLVREVFEEIVRDEAGHVRFHAARLRGELEYHYQNSQKAIWIKLVHQFGLLVTLLAAWGLTRHELQNLTGLRWREIIRNMESDYQKFFKKDLAQLKSGWVFKLISNLPA